MYNSTDILDRIKTEAARRGMLLKDVWERANVNRNMSACMKTSTPKADSLGRIADALSCSTDYLLGRSSSPNLARDLSAVLGIQDSRKAEEVFSLLSTLPPEKLDVVITMLRAMQ